MASLSVACQCGTKMDFSGIDIAKEHVCPNCASPVRMPPSPAMSAATKSLTVLIADDSPIIRKIMRTHLEERSCKIVECTDGLRAIDMTIAMKPHVIILDINMPNMNGIECLKVLKSKATTRLIPVIMCTSTSNRETVLECARAGACDFIVKPLNHKVLYEKILRIAGNLQEDKH